MDPDEVPVGDEAARASFGSVHRAFEAMADLDGLDAGPEESRCGALKDPLEETLERGERAAHRMAESSTGIPDDWRSTGDELGDDSRPEACTLYGAIAARAASRGA